MYIYNNFYKDISLLGENVYSHVFFAVKLVFNPVIYLIVRNEINLLAYFQINYFINRIARYIFLQYFLLFLIFLHVTFHYISFYYFLD